MQLYFHIGDHKTGSTSIQRALYERLWSCDSVRLAYPPYLNDVSMARTLFVPARRKERDALFRAKADWLAGASGDVSVVSAEHFSNVEPKRLRRAIVEFLPEHAKTARVLAYVRPHAGSIVSNYTQRAKSGTSDQTLDQYAEFVMRNDKFDYLPRFGGWAEIFRERFALRAMSRAELRNGDVVEDFFHHVLGGAPFTLGAAPQSNESAEIHELAVIRRVQQLVPEGDLRPKTFVSLGMALAEGFARSRAGRSMGGRVRLHRALAERIAERYRTDAGDMDARFFDGRPVMVSALSAAAGEAVAERQADDLHEMFETEKLASLDEAIRAFARSFPERGASWKSVFMDRRGHLNEGRATADKPLAHDPDVQAQAGEVDRAIDEIVAAGMDLFHPGRTAKSA
ncbi:MAG: hypothetical protein DI565_12190 [Ancylobacter novellus]|uniref:Sulfotransferase domain-containing protein n=1 Tax=Ancylobacter novellus TaxID=921 RepID=A0A2W5M343_ANCNO|nr:MAG: hypothetical protein DI565_12190 [Ancylobacter novellus]